MKSLLICLLFLVPAGVARGQSAMLNYEGRMDVMLENRDSVDIHGEPATYLNIYKVDKATGRRTSLFTHTIYSACGDCNSIAYEFGACVPRDNALILYTFWCKRGDAPVSPFGVREQTYEVTDDFRLKMVDSRMYVEAYSMYWEGKEGCEGMKYLFEKPKDKEQQRVFMQYIVRVQEEYNARFVFGRESDELLALGRELFRSELDKYTGDWDKIENAVGFGYKK